MRRVAIAAVIVAGLSGCQRTLDTERLKEEIKKTLEEEIGVDVKEVSCPEDVKLKEGDAFECQAKFEDGTEADVAVEQKNAEGDVNYKLKTGLISPKKLAADFEDKLDDKGAKDAKVDCGKKLIETHKGDELECKIENAPVGTIKVRLTDETGGYEWTMAP